MTEDFLQELVNAASDDEREWLAIRDLLAALSLELAGAAYAAAVPHWFDADILAALRPELRDRAADLYAQLQSLPFVEPFEGRGHNVHELTRKLMLAHLWQNRREEFVALSERAAHYFETLIGEASRQLEAKQKELASTETTDDQDARFQNWLQEHPEIVRALIPQTRIEQIYHLLVAAPEKGATAVCLLGWRWHDSPNFAYALVSALANAVREHVEAGRVQGRGKGWGRFWEGLVASDYYHSHEAIVAFTDVITANYEDSKLNADVRFCLGVVHTRLSELPEARERYEEALPIYRAIGDKRGEASCIRSLGDVHGRLSELPEARARYEEALSIYRAIGEKIGEANCIKSLGDVHAQLSELPEARARYEEALPIYRAIGDKRGEANCIKSLGDVHVSLSELSEARARYEEALSIYRAIGEKIGEANCIRSLGDVHVRLSELSEARARYEEALPIYRAIGSKLGEANCITSLGDVHVRLSELPEARARYEEALPIYRAIGDKRGEANCITSLGDVHVRLSELPGARARYEEALSIYRAIEEKRGEANCIRSLGELAGEKKDYASAIQLLEEAMVRFRALGLPADEAGAINSLANIYDEQKDRLKAIETYTRALSLFPSQAGYILRNRARQYLKLKDMDNVARDIEAAAKLQPDNAYLFLRRGELAILQGQYAEAISHFTEALKRYPRMNTAYFGIGLAHLRASQATEALAAYGQGLSFTDSPSGLDDALEELESLKHEPNAPVGTEDALRLLLEWKEQRQVHR